MSDEVLSLLQKNNIPYRASGQDYVVPCFNPEHEDSNPSFRVDKIRGIGQCFACGYKINLFKHFGVLVNQTNIKIAGLKAKLSALREGNDGLKMLENPTSMTTSHRGISVSTYNKFGVFHTDSVPEMRDRNIFPLRDSGGRIRVFVGRHMHSDGDPKYVNYPPKASMIMFPSKLEILTKYLVLVEGAFDMLNLYDKGLTSVSAIMGTKLISAHNIKSKMLSFKMQGVTHVFLAMDGDEAGRAANEEIKPLLEDLGYIVEVVDMDEDLDPGIMSQNQIDQLKMYCEMQTNNVEKTTITNKEINENSDY